MKNLTKKIATLVTAFTMVVVLGLCLSACGGQANSTGGNEDDTPVALTMADYQARFLNAGYSAYDPNVEYDGTGRIRTYEQADDIATFFDQNPGFATMFNCTTEDLDWVIQVDKGFSAEYVIAYLVNFKTVEKAQTVVNTIQTYINEHPDEADRNYYAHNDQLVIIATNADLLNFAQGK
ncbi:MAG: hypothetical protein NC133_03905 [Prevotella sp.]|nr:hypothetical protein [Prevotella sp.]